MEDKEDGLKYRILKYIIEKKIACISEVAEEFDLNPRKVIQIFHELTELKLLKR